MVEVSGIAERNDGTVRRDDKRTLRASVRHASCLECKNGFESVRQWKSHFYRSHASALRFGASESTQGAAILNTRFSGLAITVLSAEQPYYGVPKELITPVFKTACQLRFGNPTPKLVIGKTGTQLDYDIVSAIIEAALRLLPADNTPRGIQIRQEKEAEKASKAQLAESAFVNRLLDVDPLLLREGQQRMQIKAALDAGKHDTVRVTPDVRLSRPTIVCGIECAWVEFKNTFGFRSSPYVAKRNEDQLRRYATALGPDMVVFKLGYLRPVNLEVTTWRPAEEGTALHC